MLNFISSCTLVHTFDLSSIPGSTAEGIGVKIYEDDNYYMYQNQVVNKSRTGQDTRGTFRPAD